MSKANSHMPADGIGLVPTSCQLLNQLATEVTSKEINNLKFQMTIDAMLRIAHGEQGSPTEHTLVGLAGPQVGFGKRVIIVGVNAEGKGEFPDLQVFTNPRIVKASKATNLNREGCFSTGNVCGIVERADEVTIAALDRTGKPIEQTYMGFVARIFQHEIDHLNGIRFPDRIEKDERLHWVEPEEFGDYRLNWDHWPKACSRAKWVSIKQG